MRTQATTCPHCDELLDAVTPVTGLAVPSAGDFSVCAYCAGVLIFADDQGTLRTPTSLEAHEALRDPIIRAMIGRVVRYKHSR